MKRKLMRTSSVLIGLVLLVTLIFYFTGEERISVTYVPHKAAEKVEDIMTTKADLRAQEITSLRADSKGLVFQGLVGQEQVSLFFDEEQDVFRPMEELPLYSDDQKSLFLRGNTLVQGDTLVKEWTHFVDQKGHKILYLDQDQELRTYDMEKEKDRLIVRAARDKEAYLTGLGGYVLVLQDEVITVIGADSGRVYRHLGAVLLEVSPYENAFIFQGNQDKSLPLNTIGYYYPDEKKLGYLKLLGPAELLISPPVFTGQDQLTYLIRNEEGFGQVTLSLKEQKRTLKRLPEAGEYLETRNHFGQPIYVFEKGQVSSLYKLNELLPREAQVFSGGYYLLKENALQQVRGEVMKVVPFTRSLYQTQVTKTGIFFYIYTDDQGFAVEHVY